MAQPLMPHATASWLVDNTSLTFQQIAEFCGLHILEVQAIADDTAATKLTGRDPIRAGELTHEEIEKGQQDPDYNLKMHKPPEAVRRTRGPRYTPVSKRQDKPDGIAWIIKNHPEVSDGQISKLIGAVEREGMTLVPLKLYFNEKGRAKVEIALAKGKKLHDKRESEKKRDWTRERGRLLRQKD